MIHQANLTFKSRYIPGDGECEPPLEGRLEVVEDLAPLLRVRQERRAGEPDGEVRPPRQRVLRTLGPNSTEKVWLEFWLEKPLEFSPEIPYTKKTFKNG